MNKKILGMFICILLIATAIPTVGSLKNSMINPRVPNAPRRSMAGNWTENQKLLASDGEADDNFGCSVSLSGDAALIGAYGDNNNGDDSGSAYFFIRNGTTWIQQAKLLASDSQTRDLFGFSVSLDGNTALIGAFYDDDNGADSGSAYVFTRNGTNWNQQAKLLASDGAEGDWFGYSVSLSDDTALIGAFCDDNCKGSGYVFTRTGTTWTQQAKLLASDGAAGNCFGISVSLADGTALIGTPDDGNGDASGSVYVFIRTGTTWAQQAKLLASDGVTPDQFGWSVSLSGDTALIGALGDDDNGEYSGSVYVFIRTGTTWAQQAKLLALDGATGDQFGWSVSLSDDSALIGADGDDDGSGSAYVFTRTGTTWAQQAKLLASDGATEDMFGNSVSLDGNIALIGTWGDDDNGNESGSVYVFKGPNQKTFIFGRYTNLSSQEEYITIEAVNIRMVLFKPFRFLHYVAGEEITFSKENIKALITPRFIIGRVDVMI
jgi:hypothetical protein